MSSAFLAPVMPGRPAAGQHVALANDGIDRVPERRYRDIIKRRPSPRTRRLRLPGTGSEHRDWDSFKVNGTGRYECGDWAVLSKVAETLPLC